MIQLKPWHSIGEEEIGAATRVLRSGKLSGYLGGVLGGGPEVESLEHEWAKAMGVKHAIAVNSATSGLFIALKAVGARINTRVIVSPYSMSAGVACVLWTGATPVFADIDDNYCLDPKAVDRVMTNDVVAVLTTNLFGNVSDYGDWVVPIIEDNAQAPFTHEQFGIISIDSLNVHKPMQSGEGGVCMTNDDRMANYLRGLRNHGELSGSSPGLNLRLTEVVAAIAREQLKKGSRIVSGRNALIKQLIEGIRDLPGLQVPEHNPTSSYYAFAVRTHASMRNQIVSSLNAKGVPIKAGYGGPLYRLPAFRPYTSRCPNCELIERELMLMEVYSYHLDEDIIDQIIEAFREITYGLSRQIAS